MNIKTKTTFIIIVTLIIGITIGAMLNRALLHQHIKKTFSSRNPDRLPVFYERILNPDTKQTKKIRAILKKHAETISKIRDNFREEMLAANESFKTRIEPLLTPAQKRRLNRGPFKRWEFRRRGRRSMNPLQKDNFIQSRLSFLKKELSLTEAQTVKIRQILAKQLRDQNNRRGRNWPWDQRSGNFIEDMDEVIKEILTDEQIEKYKNLQKERPIREPF